MQSIENLNTFTLNELLSDRSYQRVSKTVFLEGMEDTFMKFEERGDTRLERHAGVCDSKRCSNRGCAGYSFRGEHSGSLLALVFEEEEEEFTDICPCHEFKPFDKSLPSGEPITLTVNSAGLTKVEVRKLIESMAAALEELKQQPEKVIKWNTCLKWLKRHEGLCLKSFWTPKDDTFFDFTFLYDDLEELKEYAKMIPQFVTASEEFPGMEKEDALLSWLVKYEALHLRDGRFERFDGLTVENNHIPEGVSLDMEIFRPIEDFKSLSLQTYWPMLEKYTTFTKEDETHVDEFGIGNIDKNAAEEYQKYSDSLSYHLQKRGKPQYILPF